MVYGLSYKTKTQLWDKKIVEKKKEKTEKRKKKQGGLPFYIALPTGCTASATKQARAKQGRAKQGRAKQSGAEQSKAKRSEARQTGEANREQTADVAAPHRICLLYTSDAADE